MVNEIKKNFSYPILLFSVFFLFLDSQVVLWSRQVRCTLHLFEGTCELKRKFLALVFLVTMQFFEVITD